MKVYQELAVKVAAVERWKAAGNADWEEQHEKDVKELLDMLPWCAGLDWEASNPNRLVLRGSYLLTRNDLVRWIDFTVTVTPSLADGFDISATGNFGDDQDAKEYLGYMYDQVLNQDLTKVLA